MTYDEILNLDSITFDVTQEDIDSGDRRCNTGCPIARAVMRTLGLDPLLVRIPSADTGFPIRIFPANPDTHWNVFQMFSHSPETRDFVRKFDNYGPVQPGTFTIERVKV